MQCFPLAFSPARLIIEASPNSTFCSKEISTRAQPIYAGILVSLLAVVLATYVAVTVDLFDWDVDITLWVQGFSLGPARFLVSWLFWMGLRGVAGALLALVAGALWFRNRRIEAVFLVLVVFPDMFNFLLRALIDRPRPSVELVEVVGGFQGGSFPSGSSLHFLLFYGFLMYLAGLYIPSKRLVYVLWAVATFYIFIIGLGLIYAGRHWFSDVVGGYLYGGFYLLAWIALYRRAKGWVREGEALRLFRRFPPRLGRPLEYGLRLIT